VSVPRLLHLAAHVACVREDRRTFRLGAVAVRADGAVVAAYNGHSESKSPRAHAEARLVRKLDKGACVYIARVARGTGLFANAKPCPGCERALRRAKVKKAIYTIGPNEYGVMNL
jgi:tRNA(Arg) A34 adenosine deaminase TadA